MGKPGTRWGKKTTGLERRTRVATTERLLIQALGDTRQVYQALAEEYGVTRKEAQGYIRQVHRLWRKRSEHDPEGWRAMLSAVVSQVARDAMLDGNRKDTLAAVKLLAKMHGADAPQRLEVDVSARPVIDVSPERVEAATTTLRLLRQNNRAVGGGDDE